MDREQLPEGMRSLMDALGEEAAEKLFRMFGGEIIYIPKADKLDAANRRAAIRQEWDGHNAVALARKYHLSVRGVRKIVERTPPAPIPGQTSLFDGLEDPEKT